MTRIDVADGPAAGVTAGTLAVFATRREDDGRKVAVPSDDAAAVGRALEIDLDAELAGVRFDAGLGDVARIPTRGKAGAPVLLVVGLGAAEGVTVEVLRKGAGTAARQAAKESDLAIVVPADLAGGGSAAARAVAEGAALGAYAYTTYRSKPTDAPSLARVVLVAGDGVDSAELSAACDEAALVVRSVVLARDLVNTPPAAKRPPALAERAAQVAREHGLGVRVFDEDALREGGFGGILGVGQGSSEPPRLVELTYDPDGATGHVALVGKGITFDSGGLSLKPSAAMNTMKSDMSGAAAVLATMTALADAGVRTKVTGLMALAENMPSGSAIRVSDVLVHRGGTTVEVMNTDAEGRLVLADALTYAAEQRPDAIVDIATLTGAQVVALGKKISALMATDDGLAQQLLDAADDAGESFWRLPLPAEYADHLRSEVADFKNIGKPGEAGTLVAGLFLKEFTDGVPWAHLDIAGPAFSEEGDGFYTSKGGTGVPVRTLLAWLRAR